MESIPKRPLPPAGLGIASFVLAMIGLVVFALPILGLPISGIAFLLGAAGVIQGSVSGAVSNLRWSVAGVCLAVITFGVNLAINYAPRESSPTRAYARPTQAILGRPYVPPPASPELFP
jgi:hypothetical protein